MVVVDGVKADQLKALVEEKKGELTGHTEEANMRILAGTARSMGIEIDGEIGG